MAVKVESATLDDIPDIVELSRILQNHPIVLQTFPYDDPQVFAWQTRKFSEMAKPSKPLKGGLEPRLMVVRDADGKAVSYAIFYIYPPGPWTTVGSWRDRFPPIDDVDHLTEEKLDFYYGDVEKTRQFVMGEKPYFFCEHLATHPDHRNQGHASALMQFGMDLADEKGLEFYLASAKNCIGMYEKQGFEPRDESSLWEGMDPLPIAAQVMTPVVRPARKQQS